MFFLNSQRKKKSKKAEELICSSLARAVECAVKAEILVMYCPDLP